ncbi:MAG: type II toxin-antitoxin system VapC family toxin [Cellulomonadaceae bacterium]|jgi:predicted nucleic acid-binding protein|nr:type II toxin-antitoxin system VapC family toxin [Cellulomonadaceae bacterium]
MPSFLLDTNVVSELRRKPHQRNAQFHQWALELRVEDSYLSVITLGEVVCGVLLLERRDPAAGRVLQNWLSDTVRPDYRERTLPVTAEISEREATLHLVRTLPKADALIAATALVHDLTLVTRNTKDFHGLGIRLVNPWQFRRR